MLTIFLSAVGSIAGVGIVYGIYLFINKFIKDLDKGLK